MASPALGQPLFRGKDSGAAVDASSGSAGRQRSLGKKTANNTAVPFKNANDGYLSMLLAAPPPPPPALNNNRSQSTPRQRVPALSATISKSQRQSYDSWDLHQTSLPSIVATHSDDLTVSTIASPRHAVLAERFRAARAMYQSDTLVLDVVQEEPSEDLEKMRTILPAASSVTATTATTVSGSIPSRGRSPTESDNSSSTRMIGNHSSKEEASVTPPKRRLKIRTPVKSAEKEKRPKTPKRLRLALRPKKSVETSPPNTTPKRSVKTPSEVIQKEAEKTNGDVPSKGFFGKLFRTGRKKTTTDVGPSRSDDATLLTEMRSESTGPVKQSNSEEEGKDKENSSKKDFSKRATGSNPDTLHRGRSVHYHGHDEVSTLTAPTFDSLGRRSLDPECGESIVSSSQRIHEPSGRYLQSNGALDIDTIASYVGSLNDPPEKDDSPTTTNTRRTSMDPTDDTPRTRGSEPRESRARSKHSFRDPSPKHLLRDPSPTENTEEVPFDFETVSPTSDNHELKGPTKSDSPLPYMRMKASSRSLAPDPPLDSVSLDDDDDHEDEEPSARLLSAVIPPPPPPPRQISSSRGVVIQSPTNNSENGNLRSTRHHFVSKSPRGILRADSDHQRWKGSNPIDSDLILEQSMESGFLEDTKVNNQVNTESKSKQFSMLKAARFNAKTMAYLHAVNGDQFPSRCEERDNVQMPRNIRKLGSVAITKIASTPGKQKGSFKPLISNMTFAAHNERFKNRSQSRKQKKARANAKRDGPRKTTPFSIGASILRKRREQGLATGKYEKPKPKNKGMALESSRKKDSVETKDPIQQAGLRLLSKSAIPIQSAARKFLAQREAIDRMWGILEIQCYMRRWKAEATLLAYRNSALTLQRVFRGAQVRKSLEVQHVAAVEIQKVIRGYLACVSTFDAVYRIIVVQSLMRGFLVRTRMRRFEERCRQYSAIKVQQWWRCVSIQKQYQYFIVDVLIIQSAIRRWRAQREYKAIMDFRCTEAARCIQAAWRGFQSYSDYIFSLVDVIVVQRTARRWLAMRKVENMRRDKAATQIQAQFRKYFAQYKLLLSLMHAILIQTTIRMFLAKKLLARKRAEHCAEQVAATKIQSAWRGFSSFTDYIITHYHIVKFQAMCRGFLIRREAQLRLGSIVMIQSHARKFLAVEKTRRLQVDRIFTRGQLGGMREVSAVNRIQFWWRVVLDCRKEKHAALVIERFFLMVKREVDMEIARVQRKQMEKRRSKTEKLTLGTVKEETSTISPSSLSTSKSNRKSKYQEVSSSATRNHAVHHVKKSDSILSSDSLNFTYSADDSEISGMLSSAPKHGGPRTAAEKYASMYGIRTKKSIELQQKNHRNVGAPIENTFSSCSSIQGIQFTTSPGGCSTGLLSPLGSPPGTTAKQYRKLRHFDFEVDSEDEFGLI